MERAREIEGCREKGREKTVEKQGGKELRRERGLERRHREREGDA